MATFLDATLLGQFAGVFTWFIVWLVAFGALEITRPFGEGNRGINALLSFFVAFLVVFTTPARDFIEFVVPWFTVIAVVFFFMFLILMVLGVKMDFISDWGQKRGFSWVMALAVIIALFGLGHAFDDNNPVAPPPDAYGEEIYDTGETSGLNPREYEDGRPVPSYAQPPSQPTGELESDNGFGQTLIHVFTHPKFLGTAFLLLMGAFTIATLTRDS